MQVVRSTEGAAQSKASWIVPSSLREADLSGGNVSTAVSGSFRQSKHSRQERSFVSMPRCCPASRRRIYPAHVRVSSAEMFNGCKRHPKMAVGGQMFEHLPASAAFSGGLRAALRSAAWVNNLLPYQSFTATSSARNHRQY